MTEELKTYKDFMAMKDHLEIDHTTLEDIRAEAIKWVKEWKARIEYIKGEKGISIGIYDAEVDIRFTRILITNWMFFFNLTEKDLK